MDILSYTLGKKAGGGSAPVLQDKEVTITENGETEITADSGYDGLSSVEVTTNVPGSTPVTIFSEYNEKLKEITTEFVNNINQYIQNRNAYTNNNVTLYTPDSAFKHYLIYKDRDGKYRIEWFQPTTRTTPYSSSDTSDGFDCLVITYGAAVRFEKGFFQYHWPIKNNAFDSKKIPFAVDTTNVLNSRFINGGRYYYYASTVTYDTVEDAVRNMINNEVVYSSKTYYSSSYGEIITEDSPYVVPYTNMFVFRTSPAITLSDQLIPSQIISKNETIEVIPTS